MSGHKKPGSFAPHWDDAELEIMMASRFRASTAAKTGSAATKTVLPAAETVLANAKDAN